MEGRNVHWRDQGPPDSDSAAVWDYPKELCKKRAELQKPGGTAGLADYLNTNPIEVLKSHEVPELFTRQRLIYYRPDKEYLQRRACKFTAGDNGFMMSMLDRMHADANSVVSEMVTSVGRPLDQLAAHGADWSLASRRKAQLFMRARSGSDSETGSG